MPKRPPGARDPYASRLEMGCAGALLGFLVAVAFCTAYFIAQLHQVGGWPAFEEVAGWKVRCVVLGVAGAAAGTARGVRSAARRARRYREDAADAEGRP
jgi:hypothetical protein